MCMQLLFLGLSPGELMMVALLALLLFGSKQLPGLARSLGKGIREVKNATGEIQKEISKGMDGSTAVKDLKKIREDLDVTKDLKD